MGVTQIYWKYLENGLPKHWANNPTGGKIEGGVALGFIFRSNDELEGARH